MYLYTDDDIEALESSIPTACNVEVKAHGFMDSTLSQFQCHIVESKGRDQGSAINPRTVTA